MASPAWRGKVVVVTGGGQGIGRALCLAFARKGADVVLADTDAEAGRECERLIRSRGGQVRFIRADVSKEDDARRLARLAAGPGKAIHALVNNAGLSRFGDPLASPSALWHRVIGVNLTGAFLCARECARYMEATPGPARDPKARRKGPQPEPRGGAIVNIASTRALMSEPGGEAYAASKGGLLALTHALAISLGPRGIRVNAVSPGWIEVSDWKKRAKAKPPELRPEDHGQHPAGRVGRPEDVAAACLYLCSPQAGFVTGANLVVDGGMTRKMIYAP